MDYYLVLHPMKLNRHIAKFVAFLFLLMLGQKTGVGLLLHNLFHTTEYKESATTTSEDKAISYACNCIDDFSSPVDETVSFELPVLVAYQSVYISLSQQSSPAAFYLFNSLRGPPASVA